MRDGHDSLEVEVVTISSEDEKEQGVPEVRAEEEEAVEEEAVDGADEGAEDGVQVEAEASVQEVDAVEAAGEEGLDEAGESDSSDWSLPSLYKPPSPTGLNTL